MNSDDAIRKAARETVNFERELESLLLSAFANGAAIEGEWEIELPVSAAPDWVVEIQKRYPDGATDSTPESIDGNPSKD